MITISNFSLQKLTNLFFPYCIQLHLTIGQVLKQSVNKDEIKESCLPA